MDIKLDEPIVDEVVVIKQPETTTIPDGVLLIQRIGELFDMNATQSLSNKTKINTLIDYAKLKTKDHSPDGLKWAIRSLATKVGTPPMGEKLISYLTRYAYLYLESQKLQKELDKYTDNYDHDN